MRYEVGVYDCAGEFTRTERRTFAEALTVAREYRERWPRKLVDICNVDRCDYKDNGLTEEEREALA